MFAIIKNDPSEVNLTSADIISLAAGTNNIGDVDIASALPAGTNAIGKLAANSGVDIGDVDVTSVIPGTGATNAGKAVDSVAGATDTGSASLAVRDDALGALTPIEGDYVNLRVDANGALWTHDDALDAALAGSELQVDVVGALPAGTNAIGKLAANSGVDIGDVDILSIAAGDNNIGNVDVLTIAAGDNNIGNVDIASAIPAGTNLIGKISASLETNTIYDGSTALTPKFAIIDAATSGNNTLVAAVASKKVRVLSVFLVASAAVTARFESGADGTALTGQMQLAANGGFVLPFNPTGWFETGSNVLLNLELSGATSVDGSLVYVEV